MARVVDLSQTDKSIPVVEAIIQTALPESLLRVKSTYLTGLVYAKTLIYKGKEYTPGPLKLITVTETGLTIIPVAANYVFVVGGKTFKVNADRTLITIIAGGEPILWRPIKAIQSNDPTDTSSTFLPDDQGIVTNGTAPTPFSYFYKVNGIFQSEPLQDGVIFRYILPGSGAISWRKFALAGEGGVFEEFDTVPNAAIASIKNIDFNDLDNLDAIVQALDTVDGKPFSSVIFGRNSSRFIETTILVNGQDNKRQNGLYYFSCEEGKPENSQAVRISPFIRFQIAYIGRARVLVWNGDAFGQDEAWIRSDTPIGATSSSPRVSIETTPHYWSKAKPSIELETRVLSNLDRIAALESKVEEAEADPVAVAALATAKEELIKAIAEKADSADVNDSVEKITESIEALDLAKASQESVDAANSAIEELNKLLEANDATDDEIQAALKKAEDAIAAVEKSYTELQAESQKFLKLSGTPATPISGDAYVSLSFPVASFHIPIDGDVHAIFACTDGSVYWDESDLPLLSGTVDVMLAKPLKSRVAFIGDSSLTFEMLGDRQPGPFVFRSGVSAVEIVRAKNLSDDVYRVLPMLLQPLPSQSSPSGGGGDRLTVVALPKLPAGQWLDWPLPTGADAGKTILSARILDADGSDITWALDTRVSVGKRQVFSLVDQADLQFEYEIGN